MLIRVVNALTVVIAISTGCPATTTEASFDWAALKGCATAVLAVASVAQAFRPAVPAVTVAQAFSPALIASLRECRRVT
jgi:hypothetical protein